MSRAHFVCFVSILAAFILNSPEAFAQITKGRECDFTAGDRFDTSRPAYVSGVTKIDPKLAVPSCKAALLETPTNPRFQYEMGRALVANDDDKGARVYFERAAAQKYAAAQTMVGVLYSYGRGGYAQSDADAARFFRMASDQGDANGRAWLAYYYEQGRSVEKNTSEAVRLYKLAADQGHSASQYNLGLIYADGRDGVPKNEAEAQRLMTLSARQGYTDAQAWLEKLNRPSSPTAAATPVPDAAPPQVVKNPTYVLQLDQSPLVTSVLAIYHSPWLPILGAAVLAFLIMIIIWTRIQAARINASTPTFSDGTRRRFGIPPKNIFEFQQHLGWRRIKQRTRHRPLYDERPHLARVQDEHEVKRARRFQMLKHFVIFASIFCVLQYEVSPTPLLPLFFPTSWENAWANLGILDRALSIPVFFLIDRLSMFVGFSFDRQGWVFYAIVVITMIISFGLLLAMLNALLYVIPLCAKEFLYQMGAQWIPGARVLDQSPDLGQPTHPAAAPRASKRQEARSLNE